MAEGSITTQPAPKWAGFFMSARMRRLYLAPADRVQFSVATLDVAEPKPECPGPGLRHRQPYPRRCPAIGKQDFSGRAGRGRRSDGIPWATAGRAIDKIGRRLDVHSGTCSPEHVGASKKAVSGGIPSKFQSLI